MKNVLVVGVFDLFHRGHLELIKNAKKCGDKLFVVVNGDSMTSAYKRRPVFNEQDRKEIVASLKFVESAVISNEFDIKPYIEMFNINVVVHGDDWPHSDYLRQICCSPDYIKQKCIEMVYLKYHQGISTTGIIKDLRAAT